jgi:OTU domain-containing protein 5
MQYILSGQEYFQVFIADEGVMEYCQRKSKSGIWGDDIELQAMSEIYDRPIELYAYST